MAIEYGMADEYIKRAEHEEFCKRIEEEEHRQNKRLEGVEKKVTEINDLVISVKELAINMKHMMEVQQSQADEQKKQGDRLQELENRDGEKWRKAVGHLVTTVIGIVVGYVFMRIGM